MTIMRLTFSVMTVCGCWRPPSWSTPLRKFIYSVYTAVVFCLVHLLTLSQFMDILMNVDNADDFTDNFYVFLAMFVGSCKMCSLLSNRNSIAWMADTFEEGLFLPGDDDELKVQKRFDATSRRNTVYFVILVESTCATMICVSLLYNVALRKLMFRAWLPFDYTSSLVYTLNYIHHGVALIYASLMHVACDSLVSGLLIHICCQLEFLGGRLKRIENTYKSTLKKCIVHHEQIYRFASQLNETFRMTILVQFTVSMLVICVNMYLLAKSKGINGMFVQMIFFSSCMLTQIFFYCWYGNEVKLKSRDVSDAVFQMNWASLDTDARSIVLTVMQRTRIPIEFTSAYIVTMNLDTFVSVLKASYSAYNVLQQA